MANIPTPLGNVASCMEVQQQESGTLMCRTLIKWAFGVAIRWVSFWVSVKVIVASI